MNSSNQADRIDAELQSALLEFQTHLNLQQRSRLLSLKDKPDPSAVIIFTAQLDQENAKQRSRCVASRLSTVLESVQQFSEVVETFVSSNPDTAALIWGSVKFVLLVSTSRQHTLGPGLKLTADSEACKQHSFLFRKAEHVPNGDWKTLPTV